MFELWVKHRHNPGGWGGDARGVERKSTLLFWKEAVIRSTKTFLPKGCTENKVLQDNDGLYPEIINLQMETSIHVCSLYPSGSSLFLQSPFKSRKEFCCFPGTDKNSLCHSWGSWPILLAQSAQLSSDMANKEQKPPFNAVKVFTSFPSI